jgi:hypothetical protein
VAASLRRATNPTHPSCRPRITGATLSSYSRAQYEAGSPWQVILYIDQGAGPRQHEALADIFLGRAGGTTLRNFAAAIGTVHSVRSAEIALDHRPGHQQIAITNLVTVRAGENLQSDEPVSCGIPGFEHPGQELRTEVIRSSDSPLLWDVRARCGFATDFHYSSGT